MLCTILNIYLRTNKAFDILNNIHINLNIIAIFMYIVAFVGLLNSTKEKQDIKKIGIFSIVSLFLLYESSKQRETIFIYITFGIYLILTNLKIKIEPKSPKSKVVICTLLIITSIFVLSINKYIKERIIISKGLEEYSMLLKERRDESKMFGNAELQEDMLIQQYYSNFSAYSFTYLLENYGKILGTFILGIFVFLMINLAIDYKKTKDSYGKLLNFGIGCFLFIQLSINLLQQLGMIDLVGIVNIPFLTHNDMSIIIYMISISLIMSIYSKNNTNTIPTIIMNSTQQ